MTETPGSEMPEWMVPADKFIANAPPVPPPLIQRIIPGGGLVLLAGSPGAGKTHVVLELVRAVATGSPAFGRYQAQRGTVVVIEEEHHPGYFAERLKRAGLTDPDVIVVHRKKFKLDNGGWVEGLKQQLQERRIRLCVFDPFAEFHDKDEDRANEIGPVIGALRALQDASPDTALLLIHHTTKGSWDRKAAMGNARGSGRIAGAFDVILEVTSEETGGADEEEDLDDDFEEDGDVAMILTGLKNKDGRVFRKKRLALSIPKGEGLSRWSVSAMRAKERGADSPLAGRVRAAFEQYDSFESTEALVRAVRGQRAGIVKVAQALQTQGLVHRHQEGRKVRWQWVGGSSPPADTVPVPFRTKPGTGRGTRSGRGAKATPPVPG